MIKLILIFQLYKRIVITSLDIIVRILKLNYYNLRQQTRSSSKRYIYANAQKFRSPIFRNQRWGQALQEVLECFTHINENERLTRNVGK